MRVWLLAALLLAGAAGALAGVAWERHAGRRATYLEQLTDALDLRPEQTAAIEAILSDEDRDLDQWLEQSLSGLRDQVAERRQRTEQELLAVLDPEQRERYDRLAQPAR
jgi:Spy/CpxP family protein refolding chaperone